MKAYVINLKRSPERKMYMQKILQTLSFLEPEFVTAVDGKAMSEEMKEKQFDVDKFYSRYSRYPLLGEIGCTLSHQKCYRKIVEENEPYVLILEDDIALPNNITDVLQKVENRLRLDIPQLILLSGWYWYYNSSSLTSTYKLANVYDGRLTHAYIINRIAAKILIEERPFITADDWLYIRKKGVDLRAVLPHLVDQNKDGSFLTTIQFVENKKSIKWKILHFPYLLFLKVLKFIGHYEKA